MLTHQRAKVCLRMDQPLGALQLYSQAAQQHPADIGLLLGQARIQEALGQHTYAVALHQQVGVGGHLTGSMCAHSTLFTPSECVSDSHTRVL